MDIDLRPIPGFCVYTLIYRNTFYRCTVREGIDHHHHLSAVGTDGRRARWTNEGEVLLTTTLPGTQEPPSADDRSFPSLTHAVDPLGLIQIQAEPSPSGRIITTPALPTGYPWLAPNFLSRAADLGYHYDEHPGRPFPTIPDRDARPHAEPPMMLEDPTRYLDTITIPRPHVPHGPKGVDPDVADADYLRHAAKRLEGTTKIAGRNLTATIVQLLNDVADVLDPK